MRRKRNGAIRQTMHQYPYLIGLLSFGILAGIVQIMVVLDCFFPLLEYAPQTRACKAYLDFGRELIGYESKSA